MKKKHVLILSGLLLLVPDPILFIDEGVLLALFIKPLTEIIRDRQRNKVVELELNTKSPIIDID